MTTLVARGADVNAAEPTRGTTALMFAAANRRAEAIRALLAAGAKVETASKVVNLKSTGPSPEEEAFLAAQAGGGRRGATPAATATPAPARRLRPPRLRPPRLAATTPTLTAAAPARRNGITPPNFAALGAAAGSAGRQRRPAGRRWRWTRRPRRRGDGHRRRDAPVHLRRARRARRAASRRCCSPSGRDISRASRCCSTPAPASTPSAAPTRPARCSWPSSTATSTSPTICWRTAPIRRSRATNGVTPLYAALNVQWAPRALYPQPRAYLQQKLSYLDLMKRLLAKGADVNARLKKKVWYLPVQLPAVGRRRDRRDALLARRLCERRRRDAPPRRARRRSEHSDDEAGRPAANRRRRRARDDRRRLGPAAAARSAARACRRSWRPRAPASARGSPATRTGTRRAGSSRRCSTSSRRCTPTSTAAITKATRRCTTPPRAATTR